ncbi:hypothetical protein PR002_g27715 [Phytophthora rubi]|uniref:Uncharacterized protein n=1 Tax=Phytophthora rubi TaxID=129364 RepID=A0A6A3HKF1_9STRA|nr:hypothetical protein PR002_g27715 [Phytophthora rubi]
MPTQKAQTTRFGLVATTKPPASAGLPAYYTEYREEGNSQKGESSEDSPSSTGTPGLREPLLKRKRVSRQTPASQSVKKINSQRNQSDPKTSTRKTIQVKTKPTSGKTADADGVATTQPNAKKQSANKYKASKAKVKEVQSMQWTIQLTALAIEARFKNKLILSKFASNTSDTKEIRGMWEDTINVFHQRALAERAWDSGAPRDVSIKQFMNKLNSIRAAYRLKRARLLATGNRVNGDGPDSDDGDDDPALARKYPEMPLDYLIEAPKSDSSDSDASDSSSKRRCTGEAITESGTGGADQPSSGESESGECNVSDGGCSDTPSEARAKAKAVAKEKKQRDRQRQSTGPKRPADTVSDTLQPGFASIERVLVARRNPPQNVDMTHVVDRLTFSMESAHAAQQATSQALLQCISGLHQPTEKLYQVIAKGTTQTGAD